jgi:hypothetical protein
MFEIVTVPWTATQPAWVIVISALALAVERCCTVALIEQGWFRSMSRKNVASHAVS